MSYSRTPRMSAYVSPHQGLFESGIWSRVFPNANIITQMLRCNVPLWVGMAAVTGFLGVVAMLLGFAHGMWIVLGASLPILWVRLFRNVSPLPDSRLYGKQSDRNALASLAGADFKNEKHLARRVTDWVTRASGHAAGQGNLF